jgi:hypothetical protein
VVVDRALDARRDQDLGEPASDLAENSLPGADGIAGEFLTGDAARRSAIPMKVSRMPSVVDGSLEAPEAGRAG